MTELEAKIEEIKQAAPLAKLLDKDILEQWA